MKRSILHKDIYLYTDVYKNNDLLYNKISTSDVNNFNLEIFKSHLILLKLFSDYFLGKLKKIKSYEDIKLIKYSVGDFFENYTNSIITNERKYFVFYYLNDNYLGGELVFKNLNLKIKPKANSVIIFPSDLEYAYEVLPITYGTKYVISTFLK